MNIPADWIKYKCFNRDNQTTWESPDGLFTLTEIGGISDNYKVAAFPTSESVISAAQYNCESLEAALQAIITYKLTGEFPPTTKRDRGK